MKTFTSEQRIIQHLLKVHAQRVAVYVQKLKLWSTVGFPDLLVMHDNQTVFYEVKPFKVSLEASLKLFEPVQLALLRKMRMAGGEAYGLVVKDPATAWLIQPFVVTLQAYPVPDFAARWERQPTRLLEPELPPH